MEKKLQINPKMNRFCLALDLVNDPKLIDQYIKHHINVWPEIIKFFLVLRNKTITL